MSSLAVNKQIQHSKRNLGTFEIDPNVVQGWRDKGALREAQLSKFAPLAKLFSVLEKNEKGGFTADIVGIGLRRLNEVGKIISQTSSIDSFRGGVGLTEVSLKYTMIEAGALEARIGVIISNFEQLSLKNNEIK